MAAAKPEIRGVGVTPARRTMSDEEAVEQGWVRPSSNNEPAAAAAAPALQFSGGLLPGSARSDTYENKEKARTHAMREVLTCDVLALTRSSRL